MKVEFGVFGGSFDPPHLAHTLFASYALGAHALERVLVVPTYAHAFGKTLAPFEDRVRMCELAFADLPRVEVSSIERELPVPNLTLTLVQALQRRHPGVQLRLLIGADIVPETRAWHDFASIERIAPPIVMQRQGYAPSDATQPALPAISSSEVRRRLRQRQSTAGLLHPAVDSYARGRSLYQYETPG